MAIETDIRTERLAGASRRGEMAADVSRAIVRLLADAAGRGPTKARTNLTPDMCVVTVEDVLTPVEQLLASNGRIETVRRQREAITASISCEAMSLVENVLGRNVRSVMTDVDPQANLGVLVFMMEPAKIDARPLASARGE